MARIVFYEKPGCINNSQQKKLMRGAGHEVDARNLLEMPWTAQNLRPYFGDLPVAQWFNRSAPDVKSGLVDPDSVDEQTALALMVKQPLLIRRPLMEINGQRFVGFDTDLLAELIGLAPHGEKDLENCPRTHTETSCSEVKADNTRT